MSVRGTGLRVLIVGAGICGLAAARTVRDWGADVEIVERQPAAMTAGAGIFLPGNALRALDRLGYAAAVMERGSVIRSQRTTNHSGRLLFEVTVGASTQDGCSPFGEGGLWAGVGPCVAVLRSELRSVLLAGVADVSFRWQCAPVAITPAGGGTQVQFTDGSSSSYDLVVGADGVHSMVRGLAFPFAVEPVRCVGQFAWRFLCSSPGCPSTWTAMLGAGSTFLTMPVAGDRSYCYCDGPQTGGPPDLAGLLADYPEPVPEILRSLGSSGETVHFGPNEEVSLDSWKQGAVLLIGDAAHATSPSLAQGAAMALEDALVLSESLAGAETVTEALAMFEVRRRPRIAWVQRHTHRRDRIRHLSPHIRDPILRQVGERVFRSNYRLLLDPP